MDNTCTYCGEEKREIDIVAVTQCRHFVTSDQCDICLTDQVCWECDANSHHAISTRIEQFDPFSNDEKGI